TFDSLCHELRVHQSVNQKRLLELTHKFWHGLEKYFKTENMPETKGEPHNILDQLPKEFKQFFV
ncbi:MAG: hypothetical protein ACOCUH_02745, partial [Bacteriovoracia bacterium]